MNEIKLDKFDYLSHYEKDAEQFDYFQQRSGATEHSERRLREYVLSLIQKSTGSILDVGCGSAWIAKHFQRSQVFICSLDVSLRNTAEALKRYPSLNHVAVVADSYSLPFRDNSFDCIIATEIIEHVQDPKGFIDELCRVTKPGGNVIVSTPYKERIKYEICVHCNESTPHNAHLHSFDEKSLSSLFDPDKIVSFNWTAFNNKLLLFARTHTALRFLPFGIWKKVDSLASRVVDRKVNIVVRATKR